MGTEVDGRAAVTHIGQSNGVFSKILASVGLDKFVYLYDTSVILLLMVHPQSNELVRTYKANSQVYDMAFCNTGDVLCLATQEPQVTLLDIRV